MSNPPPPYIPHHTVLAWASAYVAAGISVLPITPDGSKQPAGYLLPMHQPSPTTPPRRSWTPLQTRLPSIGELERWFAGGAIPNGIAAVCGTISGGLEAIDIDHSDLAQPWLRQVQEAAPGLHDRLVLVQTPRPGLHAYYRCEIIQDNQKLAQAVVTDETGLPKIKTLIETRGEGGYALVPPSPAECHSTQRMYKYLSPRTLIDVAVITPEERSLLFSISRSFGQVPQREIQARPAPTPIADRRADGNRPGDIYNARADWTELLERHGWCYEVDGSDGVSFWCRPGKTAGTSASLNYEQSDRLHVFTSNAAPLEQDRSYSKFEFFAVMEHGGDFSAAAVALKEAGYRPPALAFGRRENGRQNPQPARRGYQDRGAAYRAATRRR